MYCNTYGGTFLNLINIKTSTPLYTLRTPVTHASLILYVVVPSALVK